MQPIDPQLNPKTDTYKYRNIPPLHTIPPENNLINGKEEPYDQV